MYNNVVRCAVLKIARRLVSWNEQDRFPFSFEMVSGFESTVNKAALDRLDALALVGLRIVMRVNLQCVFTERPSQANNISR